MALVNKDYVKIVSIPCLRMFCFFRAPFVAPSKVNHTADNRGEDMELGLELGAQPSGFPGWGLLNEEDKCDIERI